MWFLLQKISVACQKSEIVGFFPRLNIFILLMFLTCIAIQLILIRLIWVSLIACMGKFRGDLLSTEPAYVENRVGVQAKATTNQAKGRVTLS